MKSSVFWDIMPCGPVKILEDIGCIFTTVHRNIFQKIKFFIKYKGYSESNLW
jgi:hypothetical protein